VRAPGSSPLAPNSFLPTTAVIAAAAAAHAIRRDPAAAARRCAVRVRAEAGGDQAGRGRRVRKAEAARRERARASADEAVPAVPRQVHAVDAPEPAPEDACVQS
jgi:hypothetical protein